MSGTFKSCFISAPYSCDLSALKRALDDRDVDWRWADRDFEYTLNNPADLKKILRGVDFIVLVVPHEFELSNQIFEAGVAVGLGKPLLVFCEDRNPRLPQYLESVLYARVSLQDEERIQYFLNTFLQHSPKRFWRSSNKVSQPHSNWEAYFDAPDLDPTAFPSAFEFKMQKLLMETGAEIEGPLQQNASLASFQPDAVIWAEGVDGPGAFPMIIEVKGVESNSAVDRGVKQLDAFMMRSNVNHALLISRLNEPLKCRRTQNGWIFTIGDDEFERLVQTRRLFSALRTQRNRAAHGLD